MSLVPVFNLMTQEDQPLCHADILLHSMFGEACGVYITVTFRALVAALRLILQTFAAVSSEASRITVASAVLRSKAHILKDI